MAVSKVSKSQQKIAQKIDLEDILGREPTPNERERFIQEAIDFMISRTQSGEDRNGKEFKAYTKDYAELKGVSRGDVDLTLFGDMLLSIEGENLGGEVEIKIEGEEAAKAYGHITGFKGHPTIPNGKYKRDFFGLSNDEAIFIAEGIRDEDPVLARDFLSQEVNQQNISEILRNIGLIGE
ncbi:MAG: hypothetical protein CO099_02645 [Bdellovibrio sp. CG_4_9_14_3_um_filter_39_7]|nr:MAG: hypothetical protein CO099_02645 [Bdellovibrio sp. CG_4_9_14_3_um_filter_39_7]